MWDLTVTEYTAAFRAKMVRKMLPPGAVSAGALSGETGVAQSTLSRWLKDARTVGVMNQPAKKWTPAEKLRVVVEASKVDDKDLGEILRREGLHEEDISRWRSAAEAGLVDPQKASRKSPEAKRVKELERELRRKDKALAEAAALLILKKKAAAIWGDGEDDTTDRNE